MFIHKSTLWARAKRPLLSLAIVCLAAVGFSSNALAFGTTVKAFVADNADPAPSSGARTYAQATSGTWSTRYFDNNDATVTNLNAPAYGINASEGTSALAESATFSWFTGAIEVGPGGNFTIEAYVPDDVNSTITDAEYKVYKGNSIFCSSATFTLVTTITGVNQQDGEGTWMPLGVVNFDTSACYKVVLSNKSAVAGRATWADAIRFQRSFEFKATIPDMPVVASGGNTSAVTITSNSGATATQIRQLIFTCPANGYVLVTGSGESVAKSDAVGYMGLAYSIAKDVTAADINNVIQSSAQSEYNGDENRDFLSIQRFDSCTKGQSITYNLVGYRAQAQTTAASYIWNARLSVVYTP